MEDLFFIIFIFLFFLFGLSLALIICFHSEISRWIDARTDLIRQKRGEEPMTCDEAKLKIKTNAVYKHYKGAYYEILDIAEHSETHEPMVVYQNIDNRNLTWVRPASMWFDEVKPGVKRFSIKFQVKRK